MEYRLHHSSVCETPQKKDSKRCMFIVSLILLSHDLNDPKWVHVSLKPCCFELFEGYLFHLTIYELWYLITLLKIASAIIINLSKGIFCFILFSDPNIFGKNFECGKGRCKPMDKNWISWNRTFAGMLRFLNVIVIVLVWLTFYHFTL